MTAYKILNKSTPYTHQIESDHVNEFHQICENIRKNEISAEINFSMVIHANTKDRKRPS